MLRDPLWAFMLMLVSVGSLPPAMGQSVQPASPAHFGQANPGAIHGFIMLIRRRGDLYTRWNTTGRWPDDAAANAALSAHGDYWDRQLAHGRALFAGGMDWDNTAFIVFEASSQSGAEEIVASDPAVKALVFQAQVRPFNVSFITNKFDTGPGRN